MVGLDQKFVDRCKSVGEPLECDRPLLRSTDIAGTLLVGPKLLLHALAPPASTGTQ